MTENQTSNSNQSSDSSTWIEFPFRLRSKLTEFVVADDLYVRHMDDVTKARLLRLENVKYNENGRLIRCTSLPGCLINELIGPDIDERDEFCSSNYVLAAPSPERAKDFNFALKIAGNSSSALYIGYRDTSDMHFLNPPCYFGDNALVVAETDVGRLSTLVAQIKRAQSDQKLQTMLEIYKHALAKNRRNESRFIEIAIILEMLLLPNISVELSYRFSLRLAKLLNKLKGESTHEVFRHAQSIYKTRSNLVHKGEDRNIDAISPIAYNYVRILLAAYLEHPSYFQAANLDAICLS